MIRLQNENVASDLDEEAIGIEGVEDIVLTTGNGIEAQCDDESQNDTQSPQTEAGNVA